MTDWLHLETRDGSLFIDWDEIFFNANQYDFGDKSFDSQLGKIISLVQKEAFEKGFSAGLEQTSPLSKLLVQTGGRA